MTETKPTKRVAKHRIHLTQQDRDELTRLTNSTSESVLSVRRARILLLADSDHPDARRPDWHIAEVVGLTEKQVKRVRQQASQQGWRSVLNRKTRRDAGQSKVFDGEAEAKLVALCCSEPPEGRQRWSLSLLVDELQRLQIVASVCPETVRQCLKKTGLSLG